MNGRTLMVSVGRQARILTERTANAFGHKPQPLAAVVLTSSSRSGSTWLADMLSTAARLQQIFEPLHPRYDPTISSLTGFDARRDHVCSYYLRASGDYPEWHRWWQAVLAGRQRSAWTDAVPTVWFANGYLVKVIRANLMLGYVHDRFQPRLIYLVRHPCAVVQSRLALGWKADVRVLLEQEALVEDYLRPWIAWIENETDPAGAHALWWAVENLVAQSELATRPHLQVFYEHLVADPAGEVMRISDHLGFVEGSISLATIDQPSRVTRVGDTASAVERLVSWKVRLPQEDQRRILGWADRLGISWYSQEPLPIPVSSNPVPAGQQADAGDL